VRPGTPWATDRSSQRGVRPSTAGSRDSTAESTITAEKSGSDRTWSGSLMAAGAGNERRWNSAADLPDVSKCFRWQRIAAGDAGYFAWGCFRYFGERPVRLRFRFAPATPDTRLRPSAPRGCATRSPRGEAWWARQDSNLQPDRYERPALTIELQAPPRSGRKGRPATVPPSFTGMTAIRQCRVRGREQAFISPRACLQPVSRHSSPNA
jgi:hypothetical protein